MLALSPFLEKTTRTTLRPHLVSVGECVVDGSFPVYARFTHYLDILVGDQIVGITDLPTHEGPSSIIIGGALPHDWTKTIQTVALKPDALVLDDLVLPRATAQTYRDRIQLGIFTSLKSTSRQRLFEICLRELVSQAPAISMAVVFDPARERGFSSSLDKVMLTRFLAGAAACTSFDWDKAVQLLLGVGYGLTPSGDDFLCGMMLSLYYIHACSPQSCDPNPLAQSLKARLGSSSIFSRTFISHAIANRWPKALRDLVEYLGGSAASDAAHLVESKIARLIADLIAHGSTSGSDLASGFFLTACRYMDFLPSESWHKETNNGA
jgi:hypothetical protein